MTEDEKRRVKSDVIEAMRIAIEDSLSPTAHVPGNMAVAYKSAEAGFAAGIEALAGPPERECPRCASLRRQQAEECSALAALRERGMKLSDAQNAKADAAPKP